MKHAFTTTYCLYNGSFYEQKVVVAMGSAPDPSSGKPLNKTLQTARHKNSNQNTNSLVQVHDNIFIYGYTERRSYKIFWDTYMVSIRTFNLQRK